MRTPATPPWSKPRSEVMDPYDSIFSLELTDEEKVELIKSLLRLAASGPVRTTPHPWAEKLFDDAGTAS